jgi:hypothetical protein
VKAVTGQQVAGYGLQVTELASEYDQAGRLVSVGGGDMKAVTGLTTPNPRRYEAIKILAE